MARILHFLKSHWLVLGVSIGLPLLSLLPFLFGGRIFLNTDATYQYYEYFDFYSKALHSGDSFLWYPTIFAGFPVYLSQAAGFFDPLNILIFSFFDGMTGYHFRLFFDLAATIGAAYYFGRTIGLSKTASALIGPAYLIAFNWRFLSNLLITNTLYILPLIFALYLRAVREERLRYGYALLAGVAVGWGFIAGYAQLVIYALVLLVVYACVLWCFSEKRTHVHEAKKHIAALSILAASGFVIGLPQILPALSFAPLTGRAEGVTYAASTLKSIAPGDLLLTTVPDYVYFPYVTSGRKPLYIGATQFVLALIALGAAATYLLRRRRSEAHLIAVGSITVLSLLLSLQHSVLFLLLQQLPIFHYFRFPYRWMFIGSFFLSVLAAYGFDHFQILRRAKLSRIIFWSYASMVGIFAGCILLLQLLGEKVWNVIGELLYKVFLLVYAGSALPKGLEHYHERIHSGINAWQDFTSFSDPAFLAAYVALVASPLIVGLSLYGHIKESLFRISIPLVVFFSFFGFFAVQWPTAAPISTMMSETSIVRELSEKVGPYRVYPVFSDAGLKILIPPSFKTTNEQVFTFSQFSFASAAPNFNSFFGLRSVDGYDQFAPTSFVNALAALGSSFAAAEHTAELSDEERELLLTQHHGLLSAMGVRYLVSGKPLSSPSFELISKTTVGVYELPLYVYENSSALPLYRVATQYGYVSEVVGWQDIRDSALLNTTYIGCVSCANFKPSTTFSLTLEEAANGYYRFSTVSLSPQWVVLSESLLPGWKARVDGREVPLVRANGLFMATLVAEGSHELEFEYRGVLDEASILDTIGLYPHRKGAR